MTRAVTLLIAITFVFVGCQQSESPVAVNEEVSVSLLSVTAEPESLPCGTDTAWSLVTAKLLDESGNPAREGIEVSFSTSLGTIEEASVTNELGEAVVRFYPGEDPGNANITARTLGVSRTY